MIQRVLGFVEKLDHSGATLWFRIGQGTIRRVFDSSFIRRQGRIEEGQPVEMRVVVKAGKPQLVLRPLVARGIRRSFPLVGGLDPESFR